MTIAYTTSAGRVRSLTGDINESYLINSDDEITAFLALTGDNVFSAAALACRSIAAKAARNATIISVLAGNVHIDKTMIAKYMLQLAEKYDEAAEGYDSTDPFIEWHLHIDPINGKDDSEYYESEDDDEPYYHDVNDDNGE